MWTDKQNAKDHLEDLINVRKSIENEKLQEQEPGKIASPQEIKEYRLKVIDKMIEVSEAECQTVPQKQGEVYR
jgi:hypothetical protein